LPSSAEPPPGPLHLPQTKIFSMEAPDANLTATVPEWRGVGSNGTVSGASRFGACLALVLVLGLADGAAVAGLLRAHPRPRTIGKI
ncbi:MAG: hypothetical protein ACREBW_02450, partial [Candidatus Micrarchaeaceae archaeon]